MVGGELQTLSETDTLQAARIDIFKNASVVDPDDARDLPGRYHTTGGKGFLKTGFREGIELGHSARRSFSSV